MAQNLHRYPGVLLEKDDKSMKIVMCEASGRIVFCDEVPMFLYREYLPTLQGLIGAGWKVKERYRSVNM